MRSASRQAGRWRPVVVALGVAVAAWSVSPPAIANEPTDVRVRVRHARRRWCRHDRHFGADATGRRRQRPGRSDRGRRRREPGDAGGGHAAPSATAVVVLLHTAGADPTTFQRANGAAAELLRSLDPAVPVAIVASTGVVVAPLGTDRGASLAALGRPATPVPVAFPAALGAAGAQLAGRGYVDPLAVVIDAGADDPGAALPLDAPAPPGMGWRIIPIASTASPLVNQFAQRAGVSVPVGSDPIALVDDAVGLVAGRYSLRLPASVAAPLTVHLHGHGGDLTAAVAVPAIAPATTAAVTVPAAPRRPSPRPRPPRWPSGPRPVVLVERPAVSALVAPPPPPSESSSWWVPVRRGCGRRRGRRRRGPAPRAAPLGGPARPAGAGHRTRRRDRRAGHRHAGPGPRPGGGRPPVTTTPTCRSPSPSGAVRSPTRREVVGRGCPHRRPPPSPASVSFDRRRRVLTLAKELGNISEACRIVGVSRRSYYEWKRIADEHGIEALRPKREVRRSQEADES